MKLQRELERHQHRRLARHPLGISHGDEGRRLARPPYRVLRHAGRNGGERGSVSSTTSWAGSRMKRSSVITWDQLSVGGMMIVALIVLGVAIYKLGPGGEPLLEAIRAAWRILQTADGLRVGRTGVRGGTVRRDDQVDRVPAGRQRHDAKPASCGWRSTRTCSSRFAPTRRQGSHARPARRQGDRHLDRHAAVRASCSRATRSCRAVARLRGRADARRPAPSTTWSS